MKILVTGSQGYIGTILANCLAEKGYDVIGLDTGYYKDCNIIEPTSEIHTIEKDIRDVTPEDLKSVDAVLHLSALSNDPLGFLNAKLTMDINFEASIRLASIAKQVGVKKFILASSCSGYGINNTGIVDENSSLNPLTAYAKSKALAEQEISKLSSRSFTTVFFRSATVYGFASRLRFDLVVNNLVGVSIATGKILVKSDGTPWRPVIHIEDDCSAFLLAIEADDDSVNNKIYNVGSTDENYQIKDIANTIKKHVNCDIEFQNQDIDNRSYRVNCGKIKKELKFKTEWSLDEGIKDLVKNFKGIELDFDKFNSRKYTRVKQIKHLIETNKLDQQLRWVN